MTKEAWAHNEWMRLYIDEPENFAADFQTVIGFLGEINQGKPPSYGEECATFMANLIERAPSREKDRHSAFAGFNPTTTNQQETGL